MTGERANPREQLDNALAMVRRMLPYWWIAALVTILGTAAATGLALKRKRVYESRTVIMHRDVIPTTLLESGASSQSTRYMNARFGTMLRSGPLLEKVITENDLLASVVESRGMAAAVQDLRSRIQFRARGGGTFHISFSGPSPEEAQLVTDKLAKELIQWELRTQLDSAQLTRDFLIKERKRLEVELLDKEKSLAEFLALHPEFAEETLLATGAAGASIRARNQAADNKRRPTMVTPTNRGRLLALERQRARLKAQLDNKKTIVKKPETGPITEEERQARRDVSRATSEADRAKRRLAELQLKFTDKHPDVQTAKRKLVAAQRKLNLAKASLATFKKTVTPVIVSKPLTGEARARAEKDLKRLDLAVALERQRLAKKGIKIDTRKGAPKLDELVATETEWSRRLREVRSVRERYDAIKDKAFTADMLAASELARQGAQLTIVDPAELPSFPAGMGRKMIVMAGFVFSSMLGLGLVLAIVLFDDRIWSRRDVERMELAAVLAVIPAAKVEKKRRSKRDA